MLTIERNNPHKKISVGVVSLAMGFISTVALLSAIIPDTQVGTSKPVAVKNATIEKQSATQSTDNLTNKSESATYHSETSAAAQAVNDTPVTKTHEPVQTDAAEPSSPSAVPAPVPQPTPQLTVVDQVVATVHGVVTTVL